jgi:hypothetical protein
MANVIIFDPASAPVANRVLRYIRSVQESDFADTPNALINHDGSGDNPQVAALIAAAVPMVRWKVSGANVVQMDAADDAVLAAAQVEQEVRYAPDIEANRKQEKSRRELKLALSNWSTLDQAGINNVVKHIVTLLS